MGYRRRIIRSLLSFVLALVAGVGLAGTADATVTNPPGYFHLEVSHPISTCADAQYADPGTAVLMWRCLNTEFEEWQPVQVAIPGNRYEHCACTTATMFVNHAMSLCLAVQNNTDDSADVAIPVVQQSCDSTDEKQWWILPDWTDSQGGGIGGGEIQGFTLSDKILTVQGSGDGVPLVVTTDRVGSNQLWGPPAGYNGGV